MPRIYLKHSETGREYDVLGIDKEKGTIRLKGKHAELEEPYDVERLKGYGYELKREE